LELCPIPRHLLCKVDENFHNRFICLSFILLSFAYFCLLFFTLTKKSKNMAKNMADIIDFRRKM